MSGFAWSGNAGFLSIYVDELYDALSVCPCCCLCLLAVCVFVGVNIYLCAGTPHLFDLAARTQQLKNKNDESWKIRNLLSVELVE